MRRVIAIGCILLLGSTLAHTVHARKPEDIFGGRILVSDQPFPTAARSEDAYSEAIKRNARDRIVEDKEAKEWRVYFAAFFKQPPNDLEINVRVYDVTNGARRLVDTFEQYLSSATTRAYVSNVRLKRGDGTGGYDPNSKIQMLMEAHGRVIAEATFYLVGEVKRGPSNIDFSTPDSR